MRMRLYVVSAATAIFLTIPSGSTVFAHGEDASSAALHPETQIGLPDSRAGHKHGGSAMDISPNFTVTTVPAGPYQASRSLALRFTILDKLSGRQIKDFELMHTKNLHLIIVSSDLSEFYHVHPDLQPDGTFLLEDFEFPREVLYTMVFDLSPVGSGGIVLYQDIQVGRGEGIPPQLIPTQFPVTESGYRLELKTDPAVPKTVGNTELTFTISDGTGMPVTDLEPYLGAAAHLVMISSKDLSIDYLHVHPLENYPTDPAQLATVRFGPEIGFQASFTRPGPYKGWLQIQRNGVNSILPFSITVERGFGLTRDQVAVMVHTVQKREESRAMIKFIVLATLLSGMTALFYPRRQKPAVSETPAQPLSSAQEAARGN